MLYSSYYKISNMRFHFYIDHEFNTRPKDKSYPVIKKGYQKEAYEWLQKARQKNIKKALNKIKVIKKKKQKVYKAMEILRDFKKKKI